MRVRVRGRSMLPTLADGAEVEVSLAATPRVGDVVLFLEGALPTMHRVLSLRGGRALTQGDACPRPDAPFDAARIVGVALVPRRALFARRRALAESVRMLARRAVGPRAVAWLRALR